MPGPPLGPPPDGGPPEAVARRYTPTALPSRGARALAFAAILVAGLCGGLIGWAVTDLQCGSEARAGEAADDDGGCSTWSAAGALGGAVLAAGGVGVVSVLVLRAMVEWRRTLDVEDLPPG